MKGGYILVNGKFYPENELLFSGIDLQRLSCGIKESFHAENNAILFAANNFNYLQNALNKIGFDPPKDWDLSRFKHDASRLLNKNHLFLAARIRLYFFQGSEKTDYILSAEEIPKGYYPLNDPGLMIDFYREGTKSDSCLNQFETSGRYLWLSATETAKSKSKNNLIIFNDKGYACEAISASYCYLINETAVFPSVEAMGYQPPLNETIIKCALSCGYTISHREDISQEDLLNAEELFLIDNCLGIQKVLGLGDRRYYSNKTAILAEKLKELAVKG